jgi:hypothetical protein
VVKEKDREAGWTVTSTSMLIVLIVGVVGMLCPRAVCTIISLLIFCQEMPMDRNIVLALPTTSKSSDKFKGGAT